MTSSPLSLSLTDIEALQAALVEVAGQSFFAFAEPCTADEVAGEWRADAPWISARMGFASREHHGEASVSLPLALAEELATSFAGCDAADLSDALVADLTGELCNMFCGLWLTRTRPHEAAGLQPPDVRRGGPPALTEPSLFMRVNGVAVAFAASGPEQV